MKKTLLGALLSILSIALAAPAFAEDGIGDAPKAKGNKMSKAGRTFGMGDKERGKQEAIKDARSEGKEKVAIGRRGAKRAVANRIGAKNRAEDARHVKQAKAGAKFAKGGRKQLRAGTKAKKAQTKRVGKRFGAKKVAE